MYLYAVRCEMYSRVREIPRKLIMAAYVFKWVYRPTTTDFSPVIIPGYIYENAERYEKQDTLTMDRSIEGLIGEFLE